MGGGGQICEFQIKAKVDLCRPWWADRPCDECKSSTQRTKTSKSLLAKTSLTFADGEGVPCIAAKLDDDLWNGVFANWTKHKYGRRLTESQEMLIRPLWDNFKKYFPYTTFHTNCRSSSSSSGSMRWARRSLNTKT